MIEKIPGHLLLQEFRIKEQEFSSQLHEMKRQLHSQQQMLDGGENAETVLQKHMVKMANIFKLDFFFFF